MHQCFEKFSLTNSNDVQRSKATSSTKHEGLEHKKSSPYGLSAHIASFFTCFMKNKEIQTNSDIINKNLQPVMSMIPIFSTTKELEWMTCLILNDVNKNCHETFVIDFGTSKKIGNQSYACNIF